MAYFSSSVTKTNPHKKLGRPIGILLCKLCRSKSIGLFVHTFFIQGLELLNMSHINILELLDFSHINIKNKFIQEDKE